MEIPCAFHGLFSFGPGLALMVAASADCALRRGADHPMAMTPLVPNDHSHGACRRLRLSDGQRQGEFTAIVPVPRWASAFFIHYPAQGAPWIFKERGDFIVGKFRPEGFRESSLSKLIEPTIPGGQRDGGMVYGMHPAFAIGFVVARNDRKFVPAMGAGE